MAAVVAELGSFVFTSPQSEPLTLKPEPVHKFSILRAVEMEYDKHLKRKKKERRREKEKERRREKAIKKKEERARAGDGGLEEAMRSEHPVTRPVLKQLQEMISVGAAITGDIQVMVRRMAPVALSTLVEICQDEYEPAKDRVAAAQALLDRAYGKAPQPVTGAGGVGPVDMDMHLDVRFVAAAAKAVDDICPGQEHDHGGQVIDALALMNGTHD